jgi:FkbM family methyltransferase
MSGVPPHLPVSWADHWEDVRLWRVLRRLEPGFYVDVGAMDPSEDSVTKAAYEHGWVGLDVEPNPYYAARLREERPLDMVAEVAAGTDHARVPLNVIVSAEGAQTGLTTLETHIAERHRTEGSRVELTEVEMVPLRELMDGTPASDPGRFHFLKVDVEGHEPAVLRGADLTRFRPLVVVVEARAPRRAEDTYAESEALLTEAGYRFAADDGLNRWYVRSEDADLADILTPELNPLIDGKPRRWWEVAREEELVARMEELDAAARSSSAEADALRTETAELKAKLDLVYGSTSWKLTAPLRAVQRSIRRR